MNVVFEIEVTADTPLKAAKAVQNMIQNQNCNWQFYIQDKNTLDVFSVDLDEADDDAVLPIDNYIPLIK